MERAHDLRSLPLPLADRSLLQTTQTDPATGGLPGQQRQRGEVAVVDRSVIDAPLALPGPPVQMEPQLCPPLHPDALGVMEPDRLTGATGKLWDSRRKLSSIGPA